ncbi:GNAT family N-acetyltransferase [Xanthobacteraceae bacterium Astr-EGSB]|uniref:GNAT family N-acetyltransferase n=1 Tax=Astrobacterium formosum TaxID=3069710 RepID=UPI0027B2BB28|nr:GNAT family N-acetyltransferase [Xanthobacteraceae bacterium Astr-EGSB]
MSIYCWRAMSAADLAAVRSIADMVHTAHPERPAVFAERLRLHPAGCFVLAGAGGAVEGYALSHPWDGPPPALDTLLETLPAVPSTFYIHDIALLPAARGRHAAADIMARLAEHARREGLPSLSLIAVGGTAVVWARLGFCPHEDTHAAKLASYGAGAVQMMRAV